MPLPRGVANRLSRRDNAPVVLRHEHVGRVGACLAARMMVRAATAVATRRASANDQRGRAYADGAAWDPAGQHAFRLDGHFDRVVGRIDAGDHRMPVVGDARQHGRHGALDGIVQGVGMYPPGEGRLRVVTAADDLKGVRMSVVKNRGGFLVWRSSPALSAADGGVWRRSSGLSRRWSRLAPRLPRSRADMRSVGGCCGTGGQVRRGELAPEPMLTFLPMRITMDSPVPVPTPTPVAAPAETARVEITLPDGTCIRVGADVGLATLRRVMTAVRR